MSPVKKQHHNPNKMVQLLSSVIVKNANDLKSSTETDPTDSKIQQANEM